MQTVDFILAIDSNIVNQLLPLGDSIVGAVVTIGTAFFTYIVGRRRSRAEVDNLQAEKKSIEAASGVNTAEAAQIISEAAASTVQPLLDRIKEQRLEIKYLTDRNVEYRTELDLMRNNNARLSSENELMRNKFRLQGEVPPELPNAR